MFSSRYSYQGLRYVDTTLAACVGESVTLRYDPRDMAEIRVFYKERYVCRAICPELAAETVPLREILRARNQRRRKLSTILRDRKKTVDALLEVKRANGIPAESTEATQPVEHEKRKPALKRYMVKFPKVSKRSQDFLQPSMLEDLARSNTGPQIRLAQDCEA
jgi:putative transposase